MVLAVLQCTKVTGSTGGLVSFLADEVQKSKNLRPWGQQFGLSPSGFLYTSSSKSSPDYCLQMTNDIWTHLADTFKEYEINLPSSADWLATSTNLSWRLSNLTRWMATYFCYISSCCLIATLLNWCRMATQVNPFTVLCTHWTFVTNMFSHLLPCPSTSPTISLSCWSFIWLSPSIALKVEWEALTLAIFSSLLTWNLHIIGKPPTFTMFATFMQHTIKIVML